MRVAYKKGTHAFTMSAISTMAATVSHADRL